MDITISMNGSVERDEVLALYRANNWSAAKKPNCLLGALRNSHTLITARDGEGLVGLGNAVSDGYLVVYYPHLLVHPNYQRRGIGRQIMAAMAAKYRGFHQQMLVADAHSVDFYRALGFERAGKTQAMWIYEGDEH